jgi:hypothetical protein
MSISSRPSTAEAPTVQPTILDLALRGLDQDYALSRLDDRQRQTVEMRVIGGQKWSVIAASLDRADIDAKGVTIQRARQIFSTAIGDLDRLRQLPDNNPERVFPRSRYYKIDSVWPAINYYRAKRSR